MGLLQTIIRNEAMKQDPPEIYGWRVFIIVATACLGGILFGMDAGTMGGVLVLPAFKKEFGLDGLGKIESANLSANIVSALQAGCFLGAIVAWPLADSIGGRTALITAAVIATAGTVMQAASSGYLQAVYAGRYISPRVVYKDNKADFAVQGGRWHRCGNGFSGSPIIRL
jgi:MFS family permease